MELLEIGLEIFEIGALIFLWMILKQLINKKYSDNVFLGGVIISALVMLIGGCLMIYTWRFTLDNPSMVDQWILSLF